MLFQLLAIFLSTFIVLSPSFCADKDDKLADQTAVAHLSEAPPTISIIEPDGSFAPMEKPKDTLSPQSKLVERIRGLLKSERSDLELIPEIVTLVLKSQDAARSQILQIIYQHRPAGYNDYLAALTTKPVEPGVFSPPPREGKKFP